MEYTKELMNRYKSPTSLTDDIAIACLLAGFIFVIGWLMAWVGGM